MARARNGSLARQIAEGSVTNEIVHHMDWLPTLVGSGGRARHQGTIAARAVSRQ